MGTGVEYCLHFYHLSHLDMRNCGEEERNKTKQNKAKQSGAKGNKTKQRFLKFVTSVTLKYTKHYLTSKEKIRGKFIISGYWLLKIADKEAKFNLIFVLVICFF